MRPSVRLRDLVACSGLLAPVALLAGQDGVLAAKSQNTAFTVVDETCASKTINYITHTLPQQCLRTSWSDANSSGSANTTVTVVETASPLPTTTITLESQAVEGSKESMAIQDGGRSAEQNTTAVPVTKEENKTAEVKSDSKIPEDDDSDLATGSFMSFEEWKAMMLKRSGQDVADVKGKKNHEPRRKADAEYLDTWGDDAEINLDFDVLSEKMSDMTAGAPPPSASQGSSNSKPKDGQADEGLKDPIVYDDGLARIPRPKDAGKTCKERFSFSSFDGGATVLKTSPGTKNSKAILVENKDSYMLFTCAQENKFVIVEISEDILIDTVVLANFEFFSSMTRTFRVSASDRYPVKMDKWKDLGTFQARNSRDIQPFLIEDPKIWAKYIRIEFLTHYGNEYYCPVSLLRVHGTRMLDSWKDAEGSQDDDDVDEIAEGSATTEEIDEETSTEIMPIEVESTASDVHSLDMSPWHPVLFSEDAVETCEPQSGVSLEEQPTTPATSSASSATSTASKTDTAQSKDPDSSLATSSASQTSQPASGSITQDIPASASALSYSQPLPSKQNSTSVAASSIASAGSSAVKSSRASTSSSTSLSAATRATSSVASSSPSASNTKAVNSSSTHITPPAPPRSQTTKAAKKPSNSTAISASSSPHASPSPTSHQSPDSFFKSVSKRLSHLETNTTLSLQYIEDQSKFLQEALTKMERRQFNRVDHFLDTLNNTVLGELRSVRQQYDQIWQSTVLALESQREVSAREILALSSRVGLLADEVVFQKRMAILQSLLLLGCLALVIFNRNSSGAAMGAASWFGMVPNAAGNNGNTAGNGWPPSLGSPPWRRRSRYISGHNPDSTASTPRREDSLPRETDVVIMTPEKSGKGNRRRHLLSRESSYSEKVLPDTPTATTPGADQHDGIVGGSDGSDDTTRRSPPSSSSSTFKRIRQLVEDEVERPRTAPAVVHNAASSPSVTMNAGDDESRTSRAASVALSTADTVVGQDEDARIDKGKSLPALPEDPT